MDNMALISQLSYGAVATVFQSGNANTAIIKQ